MGLEKFQGVCPEGLKLRRRGSVAFEKLQDVCHGVSYRRAVRFDSI
jgi:hypothetical protein